MEKNKHKFHKRVKPKENMDAPWANRDTIEYEAERWKKDKA